MSIIESQPRISETYMQDFAEDIFVGHETARFFVGVLAVGDVVLMPRELQSYYKKRAEVYIDEKHFLPSHVRDLLGGESDEDDRRSVHIGIIENTQDGTNRIVGTSRLIVKDEDTTDESNLLPVERLFPESFVDTSATPQSVEVSRFIARHESRMTQRILSLGLIRTMVGQLLDHNYGPAYAVIEKSLGRTFDKVKLPYDVIGASRMVDEYNTENFPVRIDPTAVMNSIQPENHIDSSDTMRMFFDEGLVHDGIGYFDETLTQRR